MIELSFKECVVIALNIALLGMTMTFIFKCVIDNVSAGEASRKTFFNGAWLFGLSFILLFLQGLLEF